MACTKILIYLLLLGFVASENPVKSLKCDCYAEKIPKHCYKLCQSATQPPPPTRHGIPQPWTPVPGYGLGDGQNNPRPPPPNPTRPPEPRRRGPCPNGNCPIQRESNPSRRIWGFDCPDGNCKQGSQPKPPPNNRQRRRSFYQQGQRGKDSGGIRPIGWGGNCTDGYCPQGKQPPPNYPPRCNWRQQGRNSSEKNKPYILKFGSSGLNKPKPSPELILKPAKYQACLEDGSCGCWGGDNIYGSMQQLQYNKTSPCEPYGCGYLYGSSCGLRWMDLYTDYEGFPGHTRIDFVTKSEIIRLMPHIDYDFANVLFFVEPGFARYIIDKHMDLPNLLFHMDEPVLYKMMQTVPQLDNRISGFTPIEISNVFCRVYDQCHFMTKFSEKNKNVIMYKVKYLEHCRGRDRITPIDIITPTTPATNSPEDPLFTESQIVAIEMKIPKFRVLIPRITKERAKLVKTLTKNFPKLFIDLPDEVVKRINNFLNTSGDKLDGLSNEVIVEGMIGSSVDVISFLVKRLFM
ncbi:unnamed protein product [Hymenolepis diminuta]|uniref:Uncharacterized protein n=1 Tax=Hymenolepis diminuta TaxID=6216 RepID=A0A564YWW3_HYMDI|nr:unnamed protein product [Hymenolepis diminuta]